jgi:hypothetical protein
MEETEEDLLAGFARALGVRADGALRSYVATGRGKLPAAAKLLAWDANSIHAFVFDTTNATGIRGASDILRAIDADLVRGESLGLHPGQVLFAGGGSGLAVVAEDEVEAIVAKLHELFAKRTLVATCTAAAVDLGAAEEGFDACVRAAGRALGRERVLTGPDAEPSVPFFALRCRVCGRRAAARLVPRLAAGGEGRPECEACHLVIERGKHNVRFQGEPSDFAAIADAGGFYAVMYLDGNGIGKALTHLASPSRYRRFSRAIVKVFAETLHQTAGRHGLGEDGGGATGAFQLPICGGDDVVAILPGDAAVPFARDVLAGLQAAADAHPDLERDAIGAAAGVAIARTGFPVRHLLAEAEGLLAEAKRRTYHDHSRGSLSFSVVTDGSPRSEAREAERWARPAGELLLSGRPYRLEELEAFSVRLRRIRGAAIGRTQLHALHAHAARGPAQFRNHVLYQIGRRKEWRALTQALGGEGVLRDPGACVAQFAPTYEGRQVFDVADMIELLDHWREPAAAAEKGGLA